MGTVVQGTSGGRDFWSDRTLTLLRRYDGEKQPGKIQNALIATGSQELARSSPPRSKQPEGLPESSRGLRSEATTPPETSPELLRP